jgi:hypothetical protein
MAKKKKAAPAEAAAQQDDAGEQPSTSGRGRAYTVSMAVPGSMIDNTQNIEFATFVAGQVGTARHGLCSCHPCVTSACHDASYHASANGRSKLTLVQLHLQLSNCKTAETLVLGSPQQVTR